MDDLLAVVRAAGELSRLRLLHILRHAELTVTELTQILGQSQPRVSRHLKVLCEAGLLERFKEGSWVFYRLADLGLGASFSKAVLELDFDDDVLAGDRQRLAAIRATRASVAAEFFRTNAADWERIRALHAPEKDVEAAVLRALAPLPLESLLDAGTGTGRMLELCAPFIGRGTGVDVSPEMLAIARDRLERAGMAHCQVRLADIHRLPFRSAVHDAGFDAVLFHQVLHYLDDPQRAMEEVARVLRPGGRIVIADFAPHDLEFLRNELAHRRLGFADREVEGWFAASNLNLSAAATVAPSADDMKPGEGRLTVRIWTATKPSAVSQVAA